MESNKKDKKFILYGFVFSSLSLPFLSAAFRLTSFFSNFWQVKETNHPSIIIQQSIKRFKCGQLQII